MSAKSILRFWSVVFLIGGSLVLGGLAFLMGQAAIYRARDRAHLASLMAKAAPARLPSHTYRAALANLPLKMGSVLGELQIPRVGIDMLVLEGDTSGILREGAGHIPGTAMPGGHDGNVGVAAHRDTYFRPLRFIHPGDTIILNTPVGSYQYRVQSARVVEPSDVAVLNNTKQPTLTLVTCYPFYFIGHAPYRFIVRAAQVLPDQASVK
jgi:sortase A